MTENEMFGWHHRFNGHEFEQILGDGEGQGSLVCYSSWGHKELYKIQQLNNILLTHIEQFQHEGSLGLNPSKIKIVNSKFFFHDFSLPISPCLHEFIPVCIPQFKQKVKVKVKSLSRIRLFVTPWTVAHQAPPSMEFSRQEYWSGLPFLFPGDLPDPGIKPGSPALQADSLPTEPSGTMLFFGGLFWGYLIS